MMVIVNTVLWIPPCKNHEHIQRTNALCDVLLYTLCITIEMIWQKRQKIIFDLFNLDFIFTLLKCIY